MGLNGPCDLVSLGKLQALALRYVPLAATSLQRVRGFITTISQKDFLMAAAYLPSVLVPLVGLVFPAIAMASLFLYIEKEEIA